MARRPWKDIFQGQMGFSPRMTAQMESLEDDLQAALTAGSAGTGPIGPAGPTGPQGIQGIPGPTGPTGAASSVVGPAGPTGPAGPQGAAGTGIFIKGQVADPSLLPTVGNTAGDAYVVTPTQDVWLWTGGAWANIGHISGPAGPTGPQGSAGSTGAAGPQGIQGVQGVQGVTGPAGPAGATGSTGATGAAGANGAAGATGPSAASIVEIKVIDDATAATTGEGKAILCIPLALNGQSLVAAAAYVTTVSSSGLPSVGVRNVTTGFEMLSTNVTIDASETTSYTAATAPVVDAARKVVSTGDLVAIDVDAAGTGAKGLGVILTFQ